MKEKRTDISICALIGLTFLWTGCCYLTWFYHLAEFYSPVKVDMLTEVIGYIFQAAGLLIFALFEKRNAFRERSRISFTLVSLAGFMLSLLAAFSPTGPVSLIFGYAMNVVFGMIAGLYLSMLSEFAAASSSGIIFGGGYGFGSIISYLLSLIGGSNFLHDPRVFIAYAVIFALTIPLSASIIRDNTAEQSTPALPAETSEHSGRVMLSYIFIPALTVFLLSCVKGGGFYFPAADLGDHNVSLELSRSFYAAGLIAAGLINDRRRPAGAILCVAALVFPFFTMIAGAHNGINYILWILGYVFFGFYAVYRVLLFIDISQTGKKLAWLASAGLLFGRLGDAAGAAFGMMLEDQPMLLITVMAALFVLCIFLFFQLYHTMYMQPAPATPDYVLQFASRYGLSQRETDLMRLILEGKTNKEIAEHLYISENTVKFHVRNLLHKTGCTKRKELLSLFDSTK